MLHDTFEQLPTSIDTFTVRHRHAAGIDVHKMQATAHKLLRTIYAVLRDHKHYVDPEVDYEALVVARNAPRWQRKLVEYGYLDRNPNFDTLN